VFVIILLVPAAPPSWAAWEADGMAVCDAPGYQLEAQIVSDGAGGAIIAWLDDRGPCSWIYAQRINALGMIQWEANGVPVRTTSCQGDLAVLLDGAGGAFFGWKEMHYEGYQIRGQRVDAAGAIQWPAEGEEA
jgi:hypothetical protein